MPGVLAGGADEAGLDEVALLHGRLYVKEDLRCSFNVIQTMRRAPFQTPTQWSLIDLEDASLFRFLLFRERFELDLG